MIKFEIIQRLRRADWRTTAAFGFAAGVYVWLAFFYLPPGVYWSPDIGYKRLQAENVRFTPWLDLTIDYPGEWIDPGLKYPPFRSTFYYVWQGRIHFAQPPVMAVLDSPFVARFGDQGERVMPLVAGLISLWLAAQMMRAAGAGPVWIGMLIAALATPLMIYSLFLWEHILAVALGLGAVTLALKGPEARSRRDWILGGLLTGLAAGVRKELMLFALVLGVALTLDLFPNGQWRRRRAWADLASWAVAALFVLGLYELFSYLNSGNLVPPEFRISVAPEYTPHAYLLVTGLGSLSDFVFDPQFGWRGDVMLLAVIAYWAASRGLRGRRREAVQVAALAALLAGEWYGVQHLGGASGLVGLLSASPFLAVGLGDEGAATRKLRWIALGFYALILLSLGLLTASGPYQTGLEWGSRFALILFPLSVPSVLNGLGSIWKRAAQSWLARPHLTLAVMLIGLSVFIQALGVSRMRSPAVGPESREALLALPEKQVLTNLWWLSAAAPRVYLAKELFFVNSEEDLRAWMSAAYPLEVRGFAFVSYVPLTESIAVTLAPPGTQLRVVKMQRLSNQMLVTHVELLPAP
jgi:hypothetical protein